MIGSNVNDPDNQVKVFYDDLEEQVFIRAYFRMGYQYGWNSLVHMQILIP